MPGGNNYDTTEKTMFSPSYCQPRLQLNSSSSSSSSSLLPLFPNNYRFHHHHHPYSKHIFSRTSTFCTTLHSSSPTSSEASPLPFLPHPPKQLPPPPPQPQQSQSLSDHHVVDDESEHDRLIDNFLSLSDDGSDGGTTATTSNEALEEQMELQHLSEQLGIVVTDHGDQSPHLDGLHYSPLSVSSCTMSYQHLLRPPCVAQMHQSPPASTSSTAAPPRNNKTRLRWTSELHDQFLQAVNKLDGAEKATPKSVLKLMNVDGLTIYHVKSHLQKYRFAKYLPLIKQDNKKAACSEDNNNRVSSSTGSGGDTIIKQGMEFTESLRLQIQVQKQLHEQLEVQRVLQLRIEEHARYLQKIMEEQQKASSSLHPESPDDQQAK